jgi:hypothetical protein
VLQWIARITRQIVAGCTVVSPFAAGLKALSAGAGATPRDFTSKRGRKKRPVREAGYFLARLTISL